MSDQSLYLDIIERLGALERRLDAQRNPEVHLHDIGCRVYNSGTVNVPNNTWTAMTFDSERYDTDGIHSTVANTSRLTAQKKGVYTICGNLQMQSLGAGVYCAIAILLNGLTQIGTLAGPLGVAAPGYTDLSVATQYSLAVSDYVELMVWQSSGGAVNVLASGNKSPEFAMARLFRDAS